MDDSASLPGADQASSSDKPMRAGTGALVPGSARSTNAPPTLMRVPTMAGLLVGLRRRKVLATVTALALAAIVGFIVWNVVPSPNYMVRAMVHIAAVQESVLGKDSTDSETRFAYFQKTQMTLVRSQTVLETVLRDPDVLAMKTVREFGSASEDLAAMIEVDFAQGPEILRITMRGDREDELVMLVNAVMRSYLDEFVNTEEKRRAARLTQLERMLSTHRQKLTEKRAELMSYLAKFGGSSKLEPALPEVQMRELSLANDRLRSLQGETEKFELKVGQLQTKLKAAPQLLVPASAVEAEVNKDSVVVLHRNKLAALATREAEIRGKYLADFAEERIRKEGLLDELTSTRRSLDEHLPVLRRKIAEQKHQETIAEIEADLANAQVQLGFAREQRAKVADEIAALTRDMKDAGRDSFRMHLVSKEVEEEEKVVASIVSDIRALNVQALAPPRAKQLDRAVVTHLGAGKKRLIMTIGAVVVAFGLGLLAVALWEFRKRKVDSVDEVIHGFGVSLVGVLPRMPGKATRNLRTLGGSTAYSHWTESIDSYRMLLLRATAANDAQVILVTSAQAGEGKTSVSSHLAVSIARSGRRTLLVDCDMRKPTLHRLFGQAGNPGLAEVLRGEIEAAEAIRETPLAGLSLLPAGTLTPRTVDALSQIQTGQLFEQLRKEYDVVVLDSPPVLLVADTLTVAQYADGVIVSLLRGVSRMPKLSAAMHRIRMIGAPVLGAVLNGTDEDVYGTQYYVTVPSEV